MPKKLTTEEFVRRAREAHGDKYDYSLTEYVTAKKPVTIICPKHGAFEQSPYNHAKGFECAACGHDKTARAVRKSTLRFIREARKVHGARYGYDLTDYKYARRHVLIRCAVHGVFEQMPYKHLEGQGCPKCGFVEGGEKKQAGVAERFSDRANEVHEGRYDYAEFQYLGAQEKGLIICPDHGPFEQTPNNHLRGKGCPLCSHRISRAETEIAAFLREALGLSVDQQFSIEGKSFDIKVGQVMLEYHGLYWHSTAVMPLSEARKKHEIKRKLAEKSGFRYVAVYEDEWRDNQACVKSYLTALFGKARQCGAREFSVAEVTTAEAKAFYDAHHLLGGGVARPRHMALTDDEGRIAACMSIGRASEKRGRTKAVSLSRFCTDGRSIAGAATRLFNAFGSLPPLVSYVDLDKFTGGIYERLGFRASHYVRPDYMTVWPGGMRRHKTATRLDRLCRMEGFDPKLSEFENCERMGLHRIFHSGRLCVVRP